MSYLGYEYKKELSILVSRLTLKFNKEIKLHFFGETVINNTKCLEGFTFTEGNCDIEEYESLIVDLKCIFLNKKDTHTKSEICFIICSEPEIVQEWYDMMYEGNVAMSIIRKFGERISRETVGYLEYKKEMESKITHHYV